MAKSSAAKSSSSSSKSKKDVFIGLQVTPGLAREIKATCRRQKLTLSAWMRLAAQARLGKKVARA